MIIWHKFYLQVAVHIADKELSLGIHHCKLIEKE